MAFEWQDAEGFHVTKSFTLEPDGYIVAVSVQASRGDQVLNPGIDWGPGLGDDIAYSPRGGFLSPSYSTPAQALVHRDGSRRAAAGDGAGAPRPARSCMPASTTTTSRRWS